MKTLFIFVLLITNIYSQNTEIAKDLSENDSLTIKEKFDGENDYADLTIDVIEHKPKKVGATIITKKEIDTKAGLAHETIKVIELNKSATRGGNDNWRDSPILFRGAGPFETKYYLNGIEVDKYYHLGGMTSVIPSDMIKELEIMPSVTMDVWGNSTGGIINMDMCDSVKNNFTIGAGFQGLDFFGYTDIPIIKNGLSFSVYARRMTAMNYIDTFEKYIINSIKWGYSSSRAATYFGELSGKIDYQINPKHSGNVLYNIADDYFDSYLYLPIKNKSYADEAKKAYSSFKDGKISEQEYDDRYIELIIAQDMSDTSVKKRLPRDEVYKSFSGNIKHRQQIFALTHKYKNNGLELLGSINGQLIDYSDRNFDNELIFSPKEHEQRFFKNKIGGFGNILIDTKHFQHNFGLDGYFSYSKDSFFEDEYLSSSYSIPAYNRNFFNMDSYIIKENETYGESKLYKFSQYYQPTFFIDKFSVAPTIRLNEVYESKTDTTLTFPEYRGKIAYDLTPQTALYVVGGLNKRVESPYIYNKFGTTSSKHISCGVDNLVLGKYNFDFAGFYNQYDGVAEVRDTLVTSYDSDYKDEEELYIIKPFSTTTRSGGLEASFKEKVNRNLTININTALKFTYTYSTIHKKWLPDQQDERFNINLYGIRRLDRRHSVSFGGIFTTGKPKYGYAGYIFSKESAVGGKIYSMNTDKKRKWCYFSASASYLFKNFNKEKKRRIDFELSIRNINALFLPMQEDLDFNSLGYTHSIEQVPIVQGRFAWHFGVKE